MQGFAGIAPANIGEVALYKRRKSTALQVQITSSSRDRINKAV
jgi:hypothetical protein